LPRFILREEAKLKRIFATLLALAVAAAVAVPAVAQTYDPAKFKSSKPESAWKIALVPNRT